MKTPSIALCLCLVALLPTTGETQQAQQRELFRKLDRNRDGFLSRQEIPIEQRNQFSRLDQNRDGRISWHENIHRRQEERRPMNRKRDTEGAAALSHWKHAQISQIKIKQTWHQEPDGFERSAILSQPKDVDGKLPVVVFFHGAGGSAVGPLRQWEPLTYNKVVVSAQGYRKTWNIHGEPSQAPDVEFFQRLLQEIKKQAPQADLENVSLIGFSNGCGFIQRLMIEIEQPFSRRNFLLGSSLIEQQYHDGSFWKPKSNTDHYDTRVTPTPGKMIAYFHGTNDRVVPYSGGKRGRFPHLSALQTANAWAKANGYEGQTRALGEGQQETSAITALKFPGTEVTFYSVAGGGHGLEPHGRDVQRIIKQLLEQ
ncbi:MAG: hypothetical protein VYE64_10245 [Planctomycetota bacterium]|nr:hypothetical protein [Planctomycetota bacterium]